jgi:hypothetical protein
MTTRSMSQKQKSDRDADYIARLNVMFPYNNANMPGIINPQTLYERLREMKQNNDFKGYRLTVFETNNEYGTNRYAVEMSGMITDINLDNDSVDVDGDTHFVSPVHAYKLSRVSRGGKTMKKHRKRGQRRNKSYKQKRLRKKK